MAGKLVNLKITYLTLSEYQILPDEDKNRNNAIYFVKSSDKNYIYSNGRCYGSVDTSSTSSEVKIVRVSSEIELPTIGDSSTVYIVDSADSVYGTIYMWSDDNLRYINGSDTWMEIKAIKGGDATSA